MGGEDFSFMLNARPGAFVFVGNGDTAKLHHPNYDFNDDADPGRLLLLGAAGRNRDAGGLTRELAGTNPLGASGCPRADKSIRRWFETIYCVFTKSKPVRCLAQTDLFKRSVDYASRTGRRARRLGPPPA